MSDDALLRRYAAGREPRDLEALVRRFEPVARSLARRYAVGTYPRDDLEQVACMGLVAALQRFDPSRGVSFTSFMIPTVVGELRHFCRDTAWAAHVPRGMQEQALKVRRASEEVAGRLGRAPTADELAGELGWTQEQVVGALMAAASRAPVSLEGMADGDDGEGPALADRLGRIDREYGIVEDMVGVRRAMAALTEVERRVLALHFELGLRHQEIADCLGIAERHVGRALQTALATLRRVLGAPADDSGRRDRYAAPAVQAA